MRSRAVAVVLAVALATGVGACGDDDEDGTDGTATTSTTSPTFPPARDDPEHGGPTWAVVLVAAEDPEDPAVEEAVEAAARAGYEGVGFTDCDEGAPEAFGRPDARYTVSVYFDTEADARAAATAFEALDVDGVVAEIRTYCLD
ncbi:MAG: hypothetical protein AB7L84_15530 [Acidimicrobiia bacterium]